MKNVAIPDFLCSCRAHSCSSGHYSLMCRICVSHRINIFYCCVAVKSIEKAATFDVFLDGPSSFVGPRQNACNSHVIMRQWSQERMLDVF
jgi:hypothetical protein